MMQLPKTTAKIKVASHTPEKPRKGLTKCFTKMAAFILTRVGINNLGFGWPSFKDIYVVFFLPTHHQN